VVGKSKPERVYQILGEKNESSEDEQKNVAAFHEALDLYRNRTWDDALNLFKGMEDDRLSAIYVSRIEELMRVPPPEGWEGVFDLKQK
jgi:hypothetical protein